MSSSVFFLSLDSVTDFYCLVAPCCSSRYSYEPRHWLEISLREQSVSLFGFGFRFPLYCIRFLDSDARFVSSASPRGSTSSRLTSQITSFLISSVSSSSNHHASFDEEFISFVIFSSSPHQPEPRSPSEVQVERGLARCLGQQVYLPHRYVSSVVDVRLPPLTTRLTVPAFLSS